MAVEAMRPGRREMDRFWGECAGVGEQSRYKRLALQRPPPYEITRGNQMAQTALRVVEKESVDKQKALDAALSQIERSFGKGSIMRLGGANPAEGMETVSSGSLGLDIALGIGGLPRGRVVEIYGFLLGRRGDVGSNPTRATLTKTFHTFHQIDQQIMYAQFLRRVAGTSPIQSPIFRLHAKEQREYTRSRCRAPTAVG